MDLSEYEQNILKELERDMGQEDPKLSRRLSGGFSMGAAQIQGILIFILGVFLLIFGVANNPLPLGVIGFLVMFFGAYRALPVARKLK